MTFIIFQYIHNQIKFSLHHFSHTHSMADSEIGKKEKKNMNVWTQWLQWSTILRTFTSYKRTDFDIVWWRYRLSRARGEIFSNLWAEKGMTKSRGFLVDGRASSIFHFHRFGGGKGNPREGVFLLVGRASSICGRRQSLGFVDLWLGEEEIILTYQEREI